MDRGIVEGKYRTCDLFFFYREMKGISIFFFFFYMYKYIYKKQLWKCMKKEKIVPHPADREKNEFAMSNNIRPSNNIRDRLAPVGSILRSNH